jgi:hypothetical protein
MKRKLFLRGLDGDTNLVRAAQMVITGNLISFCGMVKIPREMFDDVKQTYESEVESA